MVRISHCHCPVNDLFITADYEKKVSLWSFQPKKNLARFDTILDYGGLRVILTPTKIPLVIAGAYHIHGICGYNGISGDLLWQRKDLKKVQNLHWIPSQKDTLIGAGFDSRSFVILNAQSGTTERTLRGVRELYSDENGEFAIQATDSEVKLCKTPEWNIIWKKEGRLNTAALNERQVLLSWVNETKCFDLAGQEIWSIEKTFLQLAWNEGLGNWLGITHADNGVEGSVLILIDKKGNIVSQKNQIGLSYGSFFGDGSHLITSTGKVLSIPDLDIVWNFV